jgi:hypothetical protein
MKILHGPWSCSLKQINKGTIKIFDNPIHEYCKFCSKSVLLCFSSVSPCIGLVPWCLDLQCKSS